MNWGPWIEDESVPRLGAYIQLHIANILTVESRVLEGTVSHTNEHNQMELIPRWEEMGDPRWGWIRWRARIVDGLTEIETEEEKELENV